MSSDVAPTRYEEAQGAARMCGMLSKLMDTPARREEYKDLEARWWAEAERYRPSSPEDALLWSDNREDVS